MSTSTSQESEPRPSASIGRGMLNRPTKTSEMDVSLLSNLSLTSKLGVTGSKIPLCANYFRVSKLPDFKFLHYHVSFQPQNDSSKVLHNLVAQYRDVLGGYIYDGGSILYLTKELPQKSTKFACTSRENVSYTMTLDLTDNVIEMSSYLGFTLLNLILRRAMGGLNLEMVGRNFFDPQNAVKIPDYKLSLWPGYVTSIGHYENDILLCCDMSYKTMRQDTVYDSLRLQHYEDSTNFKDRFMKDVICTVVYTGYNNKTYRIDDVNWNMSPSSTFSYKGREISFVDYYREKYNITIQDIKQPLLVSNPSSRDIRSGRTEVICLIPELCFATGFTDKMRTNFQLMKAVAEHTRMDPKRRVQRLRDFSNRLNTTEACMKQFRDFRTQFQTSLVQLEGRQLPQETMLFGNGKTALNDDRVDWTNAVKVSQMFQNESLTRWGIIYPKRSENDTKTFLGLLTEVARGMQYEMKEPKMMMINDDRVSTYAECLQEFIARDPKFVMIVVPNNDADRYAAIKKVSCVKNAVPTQVIVQRTMQPKKGNIGGVKSIATKVLVQINTKLGGAPWSIKFPLAGIMTVGFDVTRDKNTKKGYGAFIATMDIKQKIQFYSSIVEHSSGMESSSHMHVHMRKAIMVYYQVNGCLPQRILMYRDGVGDGNIEYVRKGELEELQRTLKDVYDQYSPDAPPKFCYIIVSKRINTRFFAKKGHDFDNPGSGVVVDNTVTHPDRYDFYLISQNVRQGSVAPTSYNIIHDSFGLSADRIQILTYKMCHLYYNWSGTTKVPCVLQYAQKLAVLVGQYLHAIPNERLDNKLYYL